jgi:CheY-like chemotaxis protein
MDYQLSAISHPAKEAEMEGESPRILIVDDEPDMCWVLKNTLDSAGYQVTTATSGRETLDLAREKRFQVVFIDAKLPDMDGLELAALIRQRSPHTAVVLISGYFYQEDIAITEGLQDELFVGFVAKPFDLEEVRLMARQAVERVRKGGNANGPHSVSG